jgi:hypothetical protein
MERNSRVRAASGGTLLYRIYLYTEHRTPSVAYGKYGIRCTRVAWGGAAWSSAERAWYSNGSLDRVP